MYVNLFIFCLFAAIILSAALAIYAIRSKEEVTSLLLLAGVKHELPHLGWAFGSDVVTLVLIGLAGLFLCINMRHVSNSDSAPKLVV